VSIVVLTKAAALLSPPPGSMVICGWLKVHGSIVAARMSWASMERTSHNHNR